MNNVLKGGECAQDVFLGDLEPLKREGNDSVEHDIVIVYQVRKYSFCWYYFLTYQIV